MTTPAEIIDKLSIINIKLYHQEDIKHDPTADDKIIADAARKIIVLNKQRNHLIEELDIILKQACESGNYPRFFPAMKDYGPKK